ncbi:MbcA/ParS/Xre antitoxin family protein [Tundrisphaera lichenicola]|uniref:MbcA/ParS/Xre antitoxin family protein n=1 Tax=Tundrisphaera lichenicola TaxID=2029860 RepID=UPI003EB9AC89
MTAEGLAQGEGQLYRLTQTGRRWLGLATQTKKSGNRSKAESPKLSAIDPSLLDDIMGIVDEPEIWLRMPNVIFEGRAPIELLGTPEEARIREQIDAAKYGMFT